MAKLNFGYEEAMNLDIETRRMFLDRIQEMFSQEKKTNNSQQFPVSKKDKDFLNRNKEIMSKGQKR